MSAESFRSTTSEVYGSFMANQRRLSSDGTSHADHLVVLIHGQAMYNPLNVGIVLTSRQFVGQSKTLGVPFISST